MADFTIPFQPGGPFVSLLGSSTNSGSTMQINQTGAYSLLVFNRAASQDAYLAYGPNSNVVASAVLPVVGAAPPPSGGPNLLPLPARTVQTFTFAGPTFFSIIIPGTGNAIVDLVPGDG